MCLTPTMMLHNVFAHLLLSAIKYHKGIKLGGPLIVQNCFAHLVDNIKVIDYKFLRMDHAYICMHSHVDIMIQQY